MGVCTNISLIISEYEMEFTIQNRQVVLNSKGSSQPTSGLSYLHVVLKIDILTCVIK